MNKTTTMINNSFLALCFILICGFSASAQDKDNQKIEQLKIAFFTEELNLSASEAKRFWPVYNKHDQRYEALRANEWTEIKKGLKNIKTLDNKEAEQLLEDYLAYKKARVTYREDFVENLKEVISPKQIMMLKKAEYDFHKKLLKQYQSDNSSKN